MNQAWYLSMPSVTPLCKVVVLLLQCIPTVGLLPSSSDILINVVNVTLNEMELKCDPWDIVEDVKPVNH